MQIRGAVLYEKNASVPYYPASVTKVATALYALKIKGDELDRVIAAEQDSIASVTPEAKIKSNYKLPAYWLETNGTHIGIKKGEEFTLKDLLGAMLIPSGNDAANVIAQSIGGKIPQFMDDMNQYLKELGCTRTTFLNPHGLHHPDHKTTANDLALITREALKYPLFCEIVAQSRYYRPKTNKQAAITLLQTNQLIRPGKLHYPKAIGVKTGYHSKGKKTLIAAAKSQGRTLIAVMLCCQDRQQLYRDAVKLFESAFNQPKIHHVILKAGPQKFSYPLTRARSPLITFLEKDLSVDYYPAEDPKVKCLLYWESLSLPIQQNQKVGEVHLVALDGKVVQKAPLLAKEKVKMSWPYNWISSFDRFMLVHPVLTWISLFIGLVVLCLALFRR